MKLMLVVDLADIPIVSVQQGDHVEEVKPDCEHLGRQIVDYLNEHLISGDEIPIKFVRAKWTSDQT